TPRGRRHAAGWQPPRAGPARGITRGWSAANRRRPSLRAKGPGRRHAPWLGRRLVPWPGEPRGSWPPPPAAGRPPPPVPPRGTPAGTPLAGGTPTAAAAAT